MIVLLLYESVGGRGLYSYYRRDPNHLSYVNFRFISSKEREWNSEMDRWAGPFMHIKDMGVIFGKTKGDKWICCSYVE